MPVPVAEINQETGLIAGSLGKVLPRESLRRVYRKLPLWARDLISPITFNLRLRLRRAAPLPPPNNPGVTIAGLFSSACGIGEGARLQADSLEAMGIAVERIDLSPWLDQYASLPRIPLDPQVGEGPVVIHMNPPLFSRALQVVGNNRAKNRKIIAYWAWELERVPQSWCKDSSKIDEFWAPSQFCADAISRVLNRPAHVVPHPVAASTANPDRAAFCLPQDAFVALSFVDLNSNMSRKNPFAAIEAFLRAAENPAMAKAVLIIKLAGATDHPIQAERVRAVALSHPEHVVLLEQRLSREARDTLIASADVVLSLHRSEGFGLTLAEAMAAGKFAIGTGWSGNLEFMTEQNATLIPAELIKVHDYAGFYDENLRWAEPDIDAAAQALVRAASNLGKSTVPDMRLIAQFTAAIKANPQTANLLPAPPMAGEQLQSQFSS